MEFTTQRRAVFLDRDGVLNRAVVRGGRPYPPATVSELELMPGAPEGLRRLRDRGFVLVVVTNQPDVARGAQRREEVEAMHARIAEQMPVDSFRACYHDDGDGCGCRKPQPGLILAAAAELGVDLASSYVVGDRWRDIEAGYAAGCRTVWINAGYAERGPSRAPDATVGTITDAVDWILEQEKGGLAANKVSGLRTKLFADGAEKASMLELYANPLIKGFTTNPTLMRKAGIASYEAFARDILAAIPDRPISFEVFADDFGEMERQGRRIAGWGGNVYVKIPVTNTRRESACGLIRRLSHEGVKVNVTAILSLGQVRRVVEALAGGGPSNVSVFAGRIADTGRDPAPLMRAAMEMLAPHPQIELIWASPRELLNVFQADSIGCHIVTATTDILKKLALVGKDLDEYSLETVRMFHEDAAKSGFTL